MALVGEMQYLTIGSNTYSLPSGGSGSTIGFVEYDVTTYDEAVQIIEDNDIVYCKIVTVENEGDPNEFTRTEYAPLVYFDDGYEIMYFSYISNIGNNVYNDDTTTAVRIVLAKGAEEDEWLWDNSTTTYNMSLCAYGTCSTSDSTTTKVVSSSGFYPMKGNIIGILFTTANTIPTPKLNINDTGAKAIYVGASTPDGENNVLKWSANTMIYFMYDGNYYRYITSVSAGDVDPSRGANTWYGTSSTGSTTAVKISNTINNFVLTKGAIVSITFTNANTADALQLSVNNTGAKAIYYNNTATSSSNKLTWDANETLTFVYTGSYYYFLGKSGLPNIPDVSGKIDTAGTGLSKSGTTLNHSNSVTAQTTQAVYPIKIDAQGHITEYGTGLTTYTRSSAGGLDWTNTIEGDAKLITKSALAYWNGSYNGTTSNLSRCTAGTIIGSDDVTTTGESSKIPKIRDSGVLEIRKYIDMHDTSSTTDYDVRLTATTSGTAGTGTLTVTTGEMQISLDSTSDATLISDITDLGWDTDVIVNP